MIFNVHIQFSKACGVHSNFPCLQKGLSRLLGLKFAQVIFAKLQSGLDATHDAAFSCTTPEEKTGKICSDPVRYLLIDLTFLFMSQSRLTNDQEVTAESLF